MILPLEKIPASLQDPKNLIIYGVPKVGKTSLLATLDNCLIIDLEEGSDYVDALKVKVKTLTELQQLCVAIKEAGNPYKFIALDTITSLEEFAKPLALKRYRETPQGSSFDGKDVTLAAHGAGWGFLREAFEDIIAMVSKVTDNIILVGHVKDKSIVNAQGQEVGSMKDFDLAGKTGRILASKSDAIGFIFRDDDGNLSINFETAGEVTAGARPTHLANKRIVVAERDPKTGEFTSKWERIYPSLNK